MPIRNFLKQTSASLAAVTIGSSPLIATTQTTDKPKDWTIQEVMDLIIQEIPEGKKETTIDTIKIGNATQKIKGIIKIPGIKITHIVAGNPFQSA